MFRYTAKEISLKMPCADPETFVWRAGYYRPYSGFAIEMAFRWPADCGPTLNADFVALRVLVVRWGPGQSDKKSSDKILFFSPQLILQKSNSQFQRNLSFFKVPEGVQHFPEGSNFFKGGPIAYSL